MRGSALRDEERTANDLDSREQTTTFTFTPLAAESRQATVVLPHLHQGPCKRTDAQGHKKTKERMSDPAFTLIGKRSVSRARRMLARVVEKSNSIGEAAARKHTIWAYCRRARPRRRQ
jgi:hypothetical protein